MRSSRCSCFDRSTASCHRQWWCTSMAGRSPRRCASSTPSYRASSRRATRWSFRTSGDRPGTASGTRRSTTRHGGSTRSGISLLSTVGSARTDSTRTELHCGEALTAVTWSSQALPSNLSYGRQAWISSGYRTSSRSSRTPPTTGAPIVNVSTDRLHTTGNSSTRRRLCATQMPSVAPLFVIHGRNDPRVPVTEAEQLTRSLTSRGVRCELVIYEDEGHGLARLSNKLDAYPRALEFLDEVLAP